MGADGVASKGWNDATARHTCTKPSKDFKLKWANDPNAAVHPPLNPHYSCILIKWARDAMEHL